MGPTMGKIEGVLPNAGLGLRIEVQPRMNVRLDFGRNFAKMCIRDSIIPVQYTAEQTTFM